MAEINQPDKHSNKKRVPKNIKVELTPMVDLGFLLITFFILTTTLQQLMVMKLIMPNDTKGPHDTIAESTSLTFILERNDSIGYYEGMSKEIRYAGFNAIRNLIRQKQVHLADQQIDKDSLVLIFKPSAKSTYKNFIDALDEVTISDCKHYYFVDPEKAEVLQ